MSGATSASGIGLVDYIAANGLGLAKQASTPTLLGGLLTKPETPGLSTLLTGYVPPTGLARETPTFPWFYVTRRFQVFQDSLALSILQEADGRTKYGGVASCLNTAYWGSNSPTDHAFYIGSWAKGTKIRPPRDVDMYFLLPPDVYHRFERYALGTNKQSALLQEVKSRLQTTYRRSEIKGSGPVVIAAFDSYNVEIVPAFDCGDFSYLVCDTNNGGRYKRVKPWAEVLAVDHADQRNNSNARRLIRMLKCWQAACNVLIKSFHLELLAIEFLDQWPHRNQSYFLLRLDVPRLLRVARVEA
jgi:hypothetical protein